MNFFNIIPKLVDGFEIKKGEKVLLHVFGEKNKIVTALLEKIQEKGGIVYLLYRSREEICKKYQQGYSPDFSLYNLCDTVIDVMFYGIQTSPNFPAKCMSEYRSEMLTIMKLLMSKEKFIQLRMPTEENALAVGMDINLYKSLLELALNINYKKMKERTSSKISELKNCETVIIKVNEHTLELDIKNRKWYKDDGMGDLPCGEIYVAPTFNGANGSIQIPKLLFKGELFENFTLYFENGELINTSDAKLMEFITSAPGDSTRIAEFGIGLNEAIKNLTGYSLFDEKICGSYHIAVGMNSAFGGKNESSLHLDFVFFGDVSYQ